MGKLCKPAGPSKHDAEAVWCNRQRFLVQKKADQKVERLGMEWPDGSLERRGIF